MISCETFWQAAAAESAVPATKNFLLRKWMTLKAGISCVLQVEDRYGVLASIASVLGNNCVSIAQIIQKAKRQDLAEIVVITDKVRERHFRDAC